MHLLLSCVPSWALLGAIILVLAAKFMERGGRSPALKKYRLPARRKLRRLRLRRLCRLRQGRRLDGSPCQQVRPRRRGLRAAIAKIMGVEASAVEKKAVVQCQGRSEHCKPKYDYKGIQSCAAAAALYGGPKTCTFACIGLGDCAKVCKFGAIPWWTARQRWTRTSAWAAVPAPPSAPSRSSGSTWRPPQAGGHVRQPGAGAAPSRPAPPAASPAACA